MKRTIKNGDIIFDGIHTREQLEKTAFKELEAYQDIEEELGIDLITLFKALKNGFYGKTWNGKIKHYTSKTHDFGFDTKRLLTFSTGYEIDDEYAIKDYGKTWALTRKELE